MKVFTQFFIMGIAVLFASADEAEDRENEAKWVQYKTVHGKQYHHTKEAQRKARFLETDRKIQAHNSKSHGYKMAHNKFSDHTEEEKKAYLGDNESNVKSRSDDQQFVSISDIEMRQLSSALDYRTHRCLGPVKNQGQCGSCWAFSAIAPLEFSRCNKTGNYVSLSEQQLVDCDPNSLGCNGGSKYHAFMYLKSTSNGSDATSFYPYTAKGSTCKFSSIGVAARVSEYGRISNRNVTTIKAALNKYGPLAVSLMVLNSFYRYSSGIYSDPACPASDETNHAVTLVGYGDGYWIVRNSWGANWGNKGYFFIKMGVNMCSIESKVDYVVAR